MMNLAVMLEPAHNYAWSYTEFRSELLYSGFAASSRLYELSILFWWNQEIRGEFICLILLGILTVSFDKHFLLSMQENMTCFMKKTEP